MHFAVYQGVPVKFCAYISPDGLEYGWVHEVTCASRAKFSVDSSAVWCGLPAQLLGADKFTIQKVINTSKNGFEVVNRSVECFRLLFLVNYPIDCIHWYGDQSGVFRKLKKQFSELSHAWI